MAVSRWLGGGRFGVARFRPGSVAAGRSCTPRHNASICSSASARSSFARRRAFADLNASALKIRLTGLLGALGAFGWRQRPVRVDLQLESGVGGLSGGRGARRPVVGFHPRFVRTGLTGEAPLGGGEMVSGHSASTREM